MSAVIRQQRDIEAPSAAYLRHLNDAQRQAVEALEGPVLVLAGAGVGKTRVLTARIAHILASGRAREHEILAVTFTNKAAREMRERVEALLGGAAPLPWLGTFHALGAKILRRHAELAGLKANFTILDADDQIRLLKQILKDDNIDEKRWPARALAHLIDGWKNRGLEPEKVPRNEAAAFAGGRAGALYALCQTRLKGLNAVDFGDLLLETVRIFRERGDVLAIYQRLFRYVLVDEYQDTNAVQYLWLRLVAQGRRNLCCVGDDDQSIYSWRGADVDNILRFETDFPGAKIIRLERNYRSTSHILGLASGLIAHNRSRLGKTLYTDAGAGEKPRLIGAWDSEAEARLIGDEIEARRREGVSLDDMAVLVRASFQMREFEDRFIEIGLPYRVIGGPRFYERAEIRDALAYLRCVAQEDDDLAFERIANTPKRGLGETTLSTVRAYSRQTLAPLIAGARRLVESEELRPAARAALRRLIGDFDRWRGRLETTAHDRLAQIILEESGYVDMLRAERSLEADGRLENLSELVRSMADFPSLQSFLEHVSLVMDAERAEGDERVSLMTLHAAKGLEFDTVFLPGWEEGLFPHPRAVEEGGRAGLEEERRLAYVGLTRARRRVVVTYAANRRMRGLWQVSAPSRFVGELPPEHYDSGREQAFHAVFDASGRDYAAGGGFASRYDTPGWRRAQARGLADVEARGQPRFDGRAVEAPRGGQPFAAGDRVFHLKFGPGAIAVADGDRMTVDFDKAGRKLVLASFLRPLDHV